MSENFIFLIFSLSISLHAKEIAFSFDDAPVSSSYHYETNERSHALIHKLKALNINQAIVFANPCKRKNIKSVIAQLKSYVDDGHLIGNHTCSHIRLDDVGFNRFTLDSNKGDLLLSPLFQGQKFFRFPFLNEGTDLALRDKVRSWLNSHQYKNGFVSIDTDDYIFSFKINQAKAKRKKIDYNKVKSLFVNHVIGAANFYDDLAIKTIGYSPKHVILLHEMDATVLFIDSLVNELKKQGWKVIGISEAYQDKLYNEHPLNLYAKKIINLPRILN